MATDQGVGGSNPLTHVILYEKAGQIVLLFSYNEPPVRIQTGSFYAPLRSVLNGCPLDIQRSPLRSALNEDPLDLQHPLMHLQLGFGRVYSTLYNYKGNDDG